MNITSKSRNVGFTLIELLTVVAVVAVLAAISFAVLTRVREKGRNTACQSNLMQLALAMQQFVQDSDGRFPALLYVLDKNTPKAKTVYWNDALMPYLKHSEFFLCPSSPIEDPLVRTHYGYNWGQLNDVVWSPSKNPKLNQIVGSHESKPVSASTTYLNVDLWMESADGTLAGGTYVETPCGSHLLGSLHSGGANFSFIDGHVKWLSQTQQGNLFCAEE